MRQKKNYKVGDIFSFEIAPNEYAFGRILLDINECLNKKLIDKTSTIYFGNDDTIFIELYKQTFSKKKVDVNELDILITGLYTSNAALLLNRWQVFDFKKVTYKDIDFPESLSNSGAFNGNFTKGELKFKINISYEEIEKINIYRIEHGAIKIPQIVLYALGRKDEIKLEDDKKEIRNIENYDIRFSKYKDEIYKLLPEEFKNTSYHDLAKKKGFDTKRFYE